MELMNTPINTTNSLNLIECEQNEQQNLNIKQNIVEKDGQFSGETFIINFWNIPGVIGFSLFVIIFLALSSIFVFFENIYVVSLYALIIIIMIMYKSVNKIVLVKDSFNKKILIKVVNCLCFNQMKLIFDLENIHFFIMTEISTNSDDYPTKRLFIINDYKNLIGIDLFENSIKQKPVKCIYSFSEPFLDNISYKQFEKTLNDFVGSSPEYKNSLLFDINNFLKDKKLDLYITEKGKYIKYSDNFFTYYLMNYPNNSDNSSSVDCPFGFIATVFNLGYIFYSGLPEKNFVENKFIDLLIIMMVDIVINLIIYYLYNCFKSIKENILRIDFILSKDFDKIFIGVVKYNQTKYVKTFEFQKDNIKKFFYKEKELLMIKILI